MRVEKRPSRKPNLGQQALQERPRMRGSNRAAFWDEIDLSGLACLKANSVIPS